MREGISQQVRAILSDVLLVGHSRVLRVERCLDVIALDQEKHARKQRALSFEACLRVSARFWPLQQSDVPLLCSLSVSTKKTSCKMPRKYCWKKPAATEGSELVMLLIISKQIPSVVSAMSRIAEKELDVDQSASNSDSLCLIPHNKLSMTSLN